MSTPKYKMGHTVPGSLIYLFLNLVSHDADAFSSAFPNIDIFITLKGKSIICFVDQLMALLFINSTTLGCFNVLFPC